MRKLNKVSDWILQETNWKFFPSNSACPIYAQDFEIYASNVASKAASFLLRTATYIQKHNKAIEYARLAAKFVQDQQHHIGFWRYDTTSNIIDNKHTAFIIEGLIDFYLLENKKVLRNAIRKGIDFYINLYPDGALEKIEISESVHSTAIRFLRHNWRKTEKIRYFKLFLTEKKELFFNPKPGRLWGYGAALTMLSKAAAAGFTTDSFMQKIFNYLKTNLLDPSGRFYYKTDEKVSYIRHEAFVYLGLVSLLDTLLKQGTVK